MTRLRPANIGVLALTCARFSLGCWKPYRGNPDAFVGFIRRAHQLGFPPGDLGENYQLFGDRFERLNLKSLGLRRHEVSVTFKIGASMLVEGEVVFDDALWTSILDDFLDRSALKCVDRLVLWTAPALDGDLHGGLLAWLDRQIAGGTVLGFGLSNVNPLQHMMFIAMVQRHSPHLIGYFDTVQIRVSRFLATSLEDVRWYSSQGFSVQAYGMLHSGLACERGLTAHPHYAREFLGDMQTVLRCKALEGGAFIRNSVMTASQHGARTLIVGVTSDDQLAVWESV